MPDEEIVDATAGEALEVADGGSVPTPATVAARTRQRQKEKSTYVLQIAYQVEHGEGDEVEVQEAWYDAATVTVPAGTKRVTVRELALAEAGVMPELGAEPLKTRLLDEDSSEITPVESKLQLSIGGTS